MPEYVFAYHGGKRPESPEEGADFMARWRTWVGGLGTAVVNHGNPVGKSSTVSSSGVADDGGANPLAGFQLVQADNMDAAVEMTKGCPHLDHGTIEVAELMEMNLTTGD